MYPSKRVCSRKMRNCRDLCARRRDRRAKVRGQTNRVWYSFEAMLDIT